MDTVQQLLDGKGREIWAVAPDVSVYEAIEAMSQKGCGALLVMRDGRLEGIVSERDYARKIILEGRSSKSTQVADIMTAPVITAESSRSVEDCLSLMTEKHIRHLPIERDGALVGVVSIGDLVKAIIAQQKFLIAQLEQYIKL